MDPIDFAGRDANLYRALFNSPFNYTDPRGLDGKEATPVNGNTPSTQLGKEAHKQFPEVVTGKPEFALPNGQRIDVLKETEKKLVIRELKPQSRVLKDGKLEGHKFEQAIKQLEGYGNAIPNPKKKVIRFELWGYVCEKGKRTIKYLKLKGWTKGATLIPGFGTVAAAWSWTSDAQAKGIDGGTLNTLLDCTPFIGTVKGAYEIVAGEDFIADQGDNNEFPINPVAKSWGRCFICHAVGGPVQRPESPYPPFRLK